MKYSRGKTIFTEPWAKRHFPQTPIVYYYYYYCNVRVERAYTRTRQSIVYERAMTSGREGRRAGGFEFERDGCKNENGEKNRGEKKT